MPPTDPKSPNDYDISVVDGGGSMMMILSGKMKRAMRVRKETQTGIVQITLIWTSGMSCLFWLICQQSTNVPSLPLHTLHLSPYLLMPWHNCVYLMKREECPKGALKETTLVVGNCC
jgi:hypothetical protein